MLIEFKKKCNGTVFFKIPGLSRSHRSGVSSWDKEGGTERVRVGHGAGKLVFFSAKLEFFHRMNAYALDAD
ncbi:MAG: hypothetical protein HW380_174 [Magnetococcales bacterium]|nr:hypothetical protein [Magnetococcales bacterium]